MDAVGAQRIAFSIFTHRTHAAAMPPQQPNVGRMLLAAPLGTR
jgi:hypothetical protein